MSDVMMNGDVAVGASPRPHLDEKPHVAGALVFLLVLAAGLGYAAFSIITDISVAGEHALAIGAFVMLAIALLIALGLRVRQRLPRHRQRGRHRDLHPQPAAAGGGDLVGQLQLPGRADLQRRGRLFGRHAAAGGTDPAGRQRRRLRHDLRAADRGDHLEPGHLGDGTAEQLLACLDRLDHGRGHRQPADGAGAGSATSGVDWGQAGGVLQRAAVQPAGRVRPVLRCCCWG